jgi:hypothetical protein
VFLLLVRVCNLLSQIEAIVDSAAVFSLKVHYVTCQRPVNRFVFSRAPRCRGIRKTEEACRTLKCAEVHSGLHLP